MQAVADRLDRVLDELQPAPPSCPVCRAPRPSGHPDPVHDAMQHAQCDTIVAQLKKQLDDVVADNQ